MRFLVAGLSAFRKHLATVLPAAAAVALLSTPAGAQLAACGSDGDALAIASALRAIRQSVDPCGESPELTAMLAAIEHCASGTSRICTDRTIHRNLFDRRTAGGARTITWNPELRSVLEPSCTDEPDEQVLRDPTASLVHELAHAAQDCEGLNPGEHELDAVRLENIYRRAAGLCQRREYGDDRLPAEMLRTCTRTSCSCSMPLQIATAASGPSPRAVTDEVSSSGDSLPLCADHR